ncbi:hypothetical protein [Cellulomonas persica]|uniref:Uncharacterized protein n=1 Tax=Cellulomonas persica TaxID=76861 RepID=A0A510V1M3_9CELL|nr:hypothetical protein [Cellulomonas persica]GEK19220.1 hypothetical protein CPE01_29530 [Cellulomonas persica]
MPGSTPREAPVPRVPTSVRVLCGIGGAALVVLGCVAVFVSENSAGTAALIAAGIALLLVAVLADRITAVEAGGVKVELGAVARKLDEADEAESHGDLERAAELRDEARALIAGNAEDIARFARTRRSSPGWRRSAAQELQMRAWADAAKASRPSREALEALYDDGSDEDPGTPEGRHVMALAMMAGYPPAASHAVATRAITEPISAFEQYHGLAVARVLALHDPASRETHALREVVADGLAAGRFGHADSDRVALARRVLELVPARPPAAPERPGTAP